MDLYYIKDFLFYNEMDVFTYFQRKVSCHDFCKDSLKVPSKTSSEHCLSKLMKNLEL